MSDIVHYLNREYPTATSREIALALDMLPRAVRDCLGWTNAQDTAEFYRRPGKSGGIDLQFVKIMNRRIAGVRKVA